MKKYEKIRQNRDAKYIEKKSYILAHSPGVIRCGSSNILVYGDGLYSEMKHLIMKI
jgi:hypothetical protein